jgi:hypothetical protein
MRVFEEMGSDFPGNSIQLSLMPSQPPPSHWGCKRERGLQSSMENKIIRGTSRGKLRLTSASHFDFQNPQVLSTPNDESFDYTPQQIHKAVTTVD